MNTSAGGQEQDSQPNGNAISSVSQKNNEATTSQGGALQRVLRLLNRLLSPTWAEWVWGAHGLLSVVIGLVLLHQLGAPAGTTRSLIGVWVVLTAGAIAWRWRIGSERERKRYLLAVVVIGVAAGALVWLAGGLSLATVKWIVGIFWITAGVAELLAWFQRPDPPIEWPWISGFIIFVGLVTITWPSLLTTEFTLVAGVWAIVLGVVHLARWVWLSVHGGELAPPASRRPALVRILLIVLSAILIAVPVLVYGTVLAGSIAENSRQASLNAFYQVPPNVKQGAPGSIIRMEAVSTPGVHGRGWRVLFRSQDVEGNMTVSSGVVYAPDSPGTNRLVVAWAHGTIGLAAQCAPSRQSSDSALLPWVNDMLDRGWVVTAPDYVGAGGTAGPDATENYTIGAEQGRDLLNGVRAARDIAEAGAGTRFAIYGHSQGGDVALWGASLAPTYTPDLTLVAVGAISAASDFGGMFHEKWDNALFGWVFGPMIAYSWTRYYPDVLSTSAILTPAGENHYQEMAINTCLASIGPALLNPTMGGFFAKDPTTDPAWRQAFVANQAPQLPKGIPAFIGHGLADTLINPGFSSWLVTRYCGTGNAVATDFMPNVSHAEAAIDAEPQYAQWLTNIVNGQAPASDCGKSLPIPPAQPLTA